MRWYEKYVDVMRKKNWSPYPYPPALEFLRPKKGLRRSELPALQDGHVPRSGGKFGQLGHLGAPKDGQYSSNVAAM